MSGSLWIYWLHLENHLQTGLLQILAKDRFTPSSGLPRVGLRAALRGRRSRPRPAKAVERSPLQAKAKDVS
ncbi:MAG: hypothetical protein WBN94_13550 [Methanothrix sp.]